MKVKIRDTITADGAKFQKNIEELKRLQVRIGIQEGLRYKDGPEVLDVAMWNELGTVHIPSRPFLRDSVDANADQINAFLQSKTKKILKGGSAEELLKEIGAFQVGLIQKQMVNGNYKENEDTYKKRKEKKHPPAIPLKDTGLMQQSIHYVIQEKGEAD